MPSWLLKKLTTKPMWYLDRCRPYPIRRKVLDFEPIEGKGDVTLAVLSTPSTVLDGLWSAWSTMRFLSSLVKLHLFVDGPILANYRSMADMLFPGSQVTNVREYVADSVRTEWYQRLAQHYGPSCKLALLMALQKETSVLYSDADVLLFHEPTELIEPVRKQNQPLYMPELGQSHDPWVLGKSKSLGLNHIPRFNSGLLWIPKNSLEVELADRIMEDWQPPLRSWYVEQTVISILMQNAGAEPLPVERYVISVGRRFYWEADIDYDQIIARHFVSPVRHVMYINGMSYLLRRKEAIARA